MAFWGDTLRFPCLEFLKTHTVSVMRFHFSFQPPIFRSSPCTRVGLGLEHKGFAWWEIERRKGIPCLKKSNQMRRSILGKKKVPCKSNSMYYIIYTISRYLFGTLNFSTFENPASSEGKGLLPTLDSNPGCLCHGIGWKHRSLRKIHSLGICVSEVRYVGKPYILLMVQKSREHPS